jgi:maleylpyruvate isomerase
MGNLDEARSALRTRQGDGARYDAPEAPFETLAFARSATAYFARLLNNLADWELSRPSLLPGVSRRHVVAQVGYQARALTRLTGWAATGVPQPMYASQRAWQEEIQSGATLPARALRGLFHHAAVHLDVEWRDLCGTAWDAHLTLPGGTPCLTRDTPWLRARELWLRAVDLDADGSFLDMPRAVVDRLIREAGAAWDGPPVTLLAPDRVEPIELRVGAGVQVFGTAADLVRWLTGRGARRLTHDGPLPPVVISDPLMFQQAKDA